MVIAYRNHWITNSLLLLAAMMINACASVTEHVDLLVNNATVYTGDGSEPFIGTIAVRDSKFIHVSSSSDTTFTADRTIDATGKFITPGLWDAHAHVRSSATGGLSGERFLQFGVTSIHDLGGITSRIKAFEQEIDRNPLTGPRIYPVYFMINGESFGTFQRKVTTEQEAQSALDELAMTGARQIKIHRAVSPELAPFIFQEAKRLGLTVTGHIPLGMDPLDACRAGMLGIEHIGSFIEAFISVAPQDRNNSQAGIDYMLSAEADHLYECLKSNKVAVTPTLVTYLAIAKRRSAGAEIPQAFKDFIQDNGTIAKRLYDEGVVILAGTDVSDLNNPSILQPGLALHDELRMMEEAGLPATALIRIATLNPATAVNADKVTGSIAISKNADFLILSDDPGKTITNLRKIEYVFKEGVLVHAALD